MVGRVQRLVEHALIEQVPRDHHQPDSAFRRRRIVSAVTIAVGTTLLGFSLATDPGDAAFYPITAAVAVVWVIGGLLSGPLHLGYIPFRGALRRPIVTPIALGLAAGAVFVVGALIVREIEPLRVFTSHVLAHATQGNLAIVTVLALANGIAEEVFFRGALFAAIGRRHPVLISTVIYTLVTIATQNPMLVFAALLMGTLFALQRRASGGILASMLTHVIWSTILILALPPIIDK
ncbi:lysostaphin resistance A-like protein [uncultured Jatrophihabitans sp.]|uniref:CPBP family intramembrane glutamic endopeptidase n=1 Tax=uncultured Jatrophihabitans sp. TaxID=1610747 RepID=UPI0035CA8B53